MMVVSDEIRSLILHRAPSHDLRKVAVAQGMNSLREDGWRIVHEGRTTVEEVMRNTKDEEAGNRFAGAAGTPAEEASRQ
jgi:type II secretory ATPase GspE/PulE/Tfp pilus assembly ATPase PilB-like protein